VSRSVLRDAKGLGLARDGRQDAPDHRGGISGRAPGQLHEEVGIAQGHRQAAFNVYRGTDWGPEPSVGMSISAVAVARPWRLRAMPARPIRFT